MKFLNVSGLDNSKKNLLWDICYLGYFNLFKELYLSFDFAKEFAKVQTNFNSARLFEKK